VVRNVCTTPAPFVRADYKYAREYSKIMAELFKPQTTAFTDIWLGGEKAATVEYWRGDITQWDIEKIRNEDNGHGIILKNKVRPVLPVYG
jgi:sulfite reductase (ferredoxin)